MSLISSRASLVHLCTLERNANIGSDDGYGNPLPPQWVTNVEDVPCRAWTSGHETVSNLGVVSVVIEVHVVVPLGTDVRHGSARGRTATPGWSASAANSTPRPA